MSPPPLAAISGRAVCVQTSSPQRFTSSMRRQSAVSAPCTGAEQHHAGVVDEHVQAAVLGVGGLDERAGLLLVGDVDLVDRRGTLELLRELLEAIAPACRQGHRGARARQRRRGGRADARRGASDRGDAACQRLVRHGPAILHPAMESRRRRDALPPQREHRRRGAPVRRRAGRDPDAVERADRLVRRAAVRGHVLLQHDGHHGRLPPAADPPRLRRRTSRSSTCSRRSGRWLWRGR